MKPKHAGGRPPGVTMPCGWGCGKTLTASQLREHFTTCPKRPKKRKGSHVYNSLRFRSRLTYFCFCAGHA